MNEDNPHRHRHGYRTYKTIDYCHYQQLCLACECGQVSQEIVRRDFSDHAQRAFANPDCSTCRRLTAFEPTHSRGAL